MSGFLQARIQDLKPGPGSYTGEPTRTNSLPYIIRWAMHGFPYPATPISTVPLSTLGLPSPWISWTLITRWILCQVQHRLQWLQAPDAWRPENLAGSDPRLVFIDLSPEYVQGFSGWALPLSLLPNCPANASAGAQSSSCHRTTQILSYISSVLLLLLLLTLLNKGHHLQQQAVKQGDPVGLQITHSFVPIRSSKPKSNPCPGGGGLIRDKQSTAGCKTMLSGVARRKRKSVRVVWTPFKHNLCTVMVTVKLLAGSAAHIWMLRTMACQYC